MIATSGPFERRFVIAAFVIYLVFQVHATAFHGYWGQDWIGHKYNVLLAAEHPWEFLDHYTGDRTNPPIYHMLAGVVRRIAGMPRYIVAIGLMNVAFGFAGACLAYAVIRRLIASPVMRVAAIIFVLFLPFVMIHAQVVASDALATPLFWLLLWLILRFQADAPDRRFGLSVASIALLLLAAVLTKFTFGSFIMATGVWAGLLWWTRLLTSRRLAIVLLVVTAVPAACVYRESVRFRSVKDPHGITIPPRLSDAAMNPRSMVWLRPADVDVLSAPAYNWLLNGTYDLLVSNKHSFPALLHLAMFTDILNIYQFDPYDYYFGQRATRSHQRMQFAVRSGIVFSVLMVIGVVVLLFQSAIGVLLRRNPKDIRLLTVLIFCLAWFFNVVGMYPLLPGAYAAGYWLPRVLAPALIGFFVVGFVFLDRLPWRSPRWHVAALVAVIAQSGLHASFLWPFPSDQELYDSNSDVSLAASSAGAVFRVRSWQDGYRPNKKGEYWLEKTLGIVVNRPDDATNIENWRLSFTVKPGPSNSVPHGVLRMSSRSFGPQLVDFDGTSNVQAEIPLAAGRNDIRVELVSPTPVETPMDLLIRMAQISEIKIVGPDRTSATRVLP